MRADESKAAAPAAAAAAVPLDANAESSDLESSDLEMVDNPIANASTTEPFDEELLRQALARLPALLANATRRSPARRRRQPAAPTTADASDVNSLAEALAGAASRWLAATQRRQVDGGNQEGYPEQQASDVATADAVASTSSPSRSASRLRERTFSCLEEEAKDFIYPYSQQRDSGGKLPPIRPHKIDPAIDCRHPSSALTARFSVSDWGIDISGRRFFHSFAFRQRRNITIPLYLETGRVYVHGTCCRGTPPQMPPQQPEQPASSSLPVADSWHTEELEPSILIDDGPVFLETATACCPRALARACSALMVALIATTIVVVHFLLSPLIPFFGIVGTLSYTSVAATFFRDISNRTTPTLDNVTSLTSSSPSTSLSSWVSPETEQACLVLTGIWSVGIIVVAGALHVFMHHGMLCFLLRYSWPRILTMDVLLVLYTLTISSMMPSTPNLLWQIARLLLFSCITLWDAVLATINMRMRPDIFVRLLGGQGRRGRRNHRGILWYVMMWTLLWFFVLDIIRHFSMLYLSQTATVLNLNVKNPISGKDLTYSNAEVASATFFTSMTFAGQVLWSFCVQKIGRETVVISSSFTTKKRRVRRRNNMNIMRR